MNQIDISIIVPLYNEQEVFEQLIQRLTSVINQTDFTCEVILINDGSIDHVRRLPRKVGYRGRKLVQLSISSPAAEAT